VRIVLVASEFNAPIPDRMVEVGGYFVYLYRVK